MNCLIFIEQTKNSFELINFSEMVDQLGVGPFGIDAFVEIHENSVLARQIVVEDTLHVAVSTDRLPDVSAPTPLGSQLDGLEPVDVLCDGDMR